MNSMGMKKFIAVVLCIAGILAMSGAADAAIVAGSKTPSSPAAGTANPILRTNNGKRPAKGTAKPAAPKKVSNTETQRITAKAGTTFGVQFVCDHAAGYAWRIITNSNPKVAVFRKSTYSVSKTVAGKAVTRKGNKPSSVGPQGRETLTFKALAKGTARIVVGYAHSAGTTQKTATIFVTVK